MRALPCDRQSRWSSCSSLAPLLVVAVVSINQNRYMDFPPEGFSLQWYAELLNDSGWRTRSGTA